ncbi:MAG: hypothetical protein ACYDH5_13760 [Acidimicrobiales bacterium]
MSASAVEAWRAGASGEGDAWLELAEEKLDALLAGLSGGEVRS